METRTLELEPETAVHGGQGSAHHRERGLLAIGFFKLLNALFYLCLGFGAFHLVHKDLGEELLKLAALLHRDPEERLVQFLLEKVDLLDAHRLRQIGAVTFIYAALHTAEGLGLIFEKGWAEYLTLVITSLFLPWELYEIARHPDWFRFGLLAINLAVLAYLIYVVFKKRAAGPEQS